MDARCRGPRQGMRSQKAAEWQSPPRSMAMSKAGALAFEVSGDIEEGEYDEPIVLFKAGRLPKEFDED